MGEFTMPSLGADMEAGTVAEWLVKPGEEVHRGDIVAVIETEKSTMEVEIFENGVIEDIVVPVGERVPVGTVLAHVRMGPPSGAKGPAAPTEARALAPPLLAPTAGMPEGPSPVFSPVVRHLAEQLEVDVTHLAGSGLGGTVTRADVERAAAEHAGVPAPGTAQSPQPLPVRTTPSASERHPPGASPYARRLAAELGVELASVTGTGPRGSVTAKDVRGAAQAAPSPEAVPIPAATAPSTEAAPLAGVGKSEAMRRAIGALMARSKREIPHYYLSTTIDVGVASAWLEQSNLARPVRQRLVLSALVLKATALAVHKVPEMNGFFGDGVFTPSPAVHVGVAISLRAGGVIAPAIHDADRLGLDELMVALQDLVGRARTGRLRASEMSDPTITVTNLGDLGVETVFGVIYPPQVALVGFGRVNDRVVARGGLLGVAPCVTATLSADHRASDGHRGGRFLAEIDNLLQEPEKL